MTQEIIVELGNIHEGSFGIAKSLIDIVSSTGANVVKFQMHLSEFESHSSEEFRVKFSDQDLTRKDYWDRVNFSLTQWQSLASYAKSIGLEFMCTPFSVMAAKVLLENTSIERWKVGSGDACNFPLIDFLLQTKLPIIISTGLISEREIIKLASRIDFHAARSRTTLMHCVSQYPTPIEKTSFGVLEYLKSLGFRVGLSDHSGNINVGLHALSLGIEILEVHLTPHKLFFGPDVSSSLTSEEIKKIVDFRNTLAIIKKSKYLTRDDLYNQSKDYRTLFRKGVYFSKDLLQGYEIKYEDLVFLKPSKFIDAIDFEKILGKKLRTEVCKGTAVQWDHLVD